MSDFVRRLSGRKKSQSAWSKDYCRTFSHILAVASYTFDLDYFLGKIFVMKLVAILSENSLHLPFTFLLQNGRYVENKRLSLSQ